MKIVVALDKFKGSLAALRACEIVRDALQSTRPGLEVVVRPMADGGDGTAEVFHTALGGEWIYRRVTGVLEAIPFTGRYLWLADRKLAVIEMASASGLALLRAENRDPLRATTLGTGELIQAAIESGATKILFGVGGSATVDGGVGASTALGWRFLAANGRRVGHGGGELDRIARIEPPPLHRKLPEIEVLCDVNNPLYGENGAARMFGPQKGATPEMVERLEAGLRHLAELVKTQLGKDLADVPGAGAAGGLAFGAMAFMNAKLVPGIDTVMEAAGLESALNGADWAITGEGRFDEQSLRGKVVAGVTKLAREHGIKVAVLAGSAAIPKAEGINIVLTVQKEGMPLDQAMTNAPKLLAETARELAARL
ncbi:MAG TPA: glycerate kinase [Verrucomicrobiae bacterium]|nr:glycerate kinase [Verrucomicrobiae bacterium]